MKLIHVIEIYEHKHVMTSINKNTIKVFSYLYENHDRNIRGLLKLY